MWTRRRAVAGIACAGGIPFVSARSCSARTVDLDDTSPDQKDSAPDIRGWPSLLDALPARIQVAVREGRYDSDLSHAIRDVIERGEDFVVPPGIYPIAGDRLECRKAGMRIVGTGGIFRRLAHQNGIGLLLSADAVSTYALRCDGMAPATPSHINDMIKVTGHQCRLVDLVVHGSWGSNLRIEGAHNCRVIHPTLTDAYQNNLIICNAPTQDILIESPICQRSKTQNNIFVTASSGSVANGDFVSGIVINNPLCIDAGDTGIELGYHCVDSRVIGGRVANSVNPALLQRDGRSNLWRDVVVENRNPADQHANYDSVAVTPQWEPASWSSDTRFENIVVKGRARRSAFYWGQSGIRRIGCIADAYAMGERPAPDGGDRMGSGDLKAGNVSDIVVQGGRIDGFVIGDDWNYDTQPHVRKDCITEQVDFRRCDRVFSCYNITPINCAIVDNRGNANRTAILLTRATLIPSDTKPNIGLLYDGNALSATTEEPVNMALLTRDSRFVRIGGSGAIRALEFVTRPGHYRLTIADHQLAFDIVRMVDKVVLRYGDPGASTGPGINVTIENGKLVLHQRDRSSPSIWAKLTGPGIEAPSSV